MKVKILSIEKAIYEGDAKFVKFLAPDGEIGILKDHAPMIALMAKGKISITLLNDSKVDFEIDDGILFVNKNNITCLVKTPKKATK